MTLENILEQILFFNSILTHPLIQRGFQGQVYNTINRCIECMVNVVVVNVANVTDSHVTMSIPVTLVS
jgi:hypothetical protein